MARPMLPVSPCAPWPCSGTSTPTGLARAATTRRGARRSTTSMASSITPTGSTTCSSPPPWEGENYEPRNPMESGLLQFGHSKDDPTRPQIKVMMGSLDPLGMPLSTDVLSGDRADDGLYLALMERIRPVLKTTGLLFVGDCKMSALETRASIAGHHDLYLSPLPLTGATTEAMEAWISEGLARGETSELVRLFRTNDRGHE